jgi:hypothetical protein
VLTSPCLILRLCVCVFFFFFFFFFLFFFSSSLKVLNTIRGAIALHYERSPEEIQQVLAWYKVRDTLFGENYVVQDMKKALELACVCEHPDALWLTKLFAGRDVPSREEAKQVFLGDENDPRARCFGGVLDAGPSESANVRSLGKQRVFEAAEMGNAFAQAWSVEHLLPDRSENCVGSACQLERDGFRWCGFYFRMHGEWRDLEIAVECYFIAAQLGHVRAYVEFAKLLEDSDPNQILWLGKAAQKGLNSFFLVMKKQMTKFVCGGGDRGMVFAIGRTLKRNVDLEKRTIFGFWKNSDYDKYMELGSIALKFYNTQMLWYRRAVDCWTFVGLRNSVVKDIRLLIAKIIWDSRIEGLYR